MTTASTRPDSPAIHPDGHAGRRPGTGGRFLPLTAVLLLGLWGCSEQAPETAPPAAPAMESPGAGAGDSPAVGEPAPAAADTVGPADELAERVTVCRVPDPAVPSSAFDIFRSEPDGNGDYWVRYTCKEACGNWRDCTVPAVMADGGEPIPEGRAPQRQKQAVAFVVDDMGGHLAISEAGGKTVFIHTGAGGTRYYADVAADLERRSTARTAMVRWDSGFVGEPVVAPFPAPVHWGWYSRSTPEGTTIRALNRRVAAIMAWAHRELSGGEDFATMGCSMGTNATFMPVLWHGLDPIVDYQLFVGGPNMWDLNAHCGRRQYTQGYCDLDGVTQCAADADCAAVGEGARCVSPRPYAEINALYDTFANHVHATTACDILAADETSEPHAAFDASSMRFADDGDWQLDHRVDFLVNVGVELTATVFGGDFYWALGDFPFVFNRIEPAANRQWHLFPDSQHCDAMTSGASVDLIIERMDLAAPASGGDDPLVRMFEWWNGAFATPGGFTEEAFARYFTADGAIVINGVRGVQGTAELARSFQEIQANTESVRIVLPFEDSFRVGDRIFTHHFIERLDQGERECLRAMGWAEVRDGKVALVNLVRVPDDGTRSYDGGCDYAE